MNTSSPEATMAKDVSMKLIAMEMAKELVTHSDIQIETVEEFLKVTNKIEKHLFGNIQEQITKASEAVPFKPTLVD